MYYCGSSCLVSYINLKPRQFLLEEKITMGKVKNKRNCFQSFAPKIENIEDKQVCISRNMWAQSNAERPMVSNIFRNMHIPPSVLKQQLLASNPEDVINAKFARRNATLELFASELRDRKKMRKRHREPMHKVLRNVLKEQVKKKKEQKQKVKKILHSYDTLKDALPTLDEQEFKEECKYKDKPRNAKPVKIKEMETSEDIKTFHSILQSPSYMSDPFGAVSAHIRAHLSSKV